MATNAVHSEDSIRQAASDTVQQGESVRERVRDLTLDALTSRRFDRGAIRDVVRAITEGASRGAESAGEGSRQSLAETFRGMDQALTKAVEAGQNGTAPVRRDGARPVRARVEGGARRPAEDRGGFRRHGQPGRRSRRASG